MYSIFFTILERRVKEGKNSGRRKEEWKKERIEEIRVKKGKKKRRKCLAKGHFDRESN